MTKKSGGLAAASEKAIQNSVAQHMRDNGYVVTTEVSTPVGRIDILVVSHSGDNSTTYIIEVKRKNASHSLVEAIGQLRQYERYYRGAKLVIVVPDSCGLLTKTAKTVLDNNKDVRYVIWTMPQPDAAVKASHYYPNFDV